MTKIQLIEIPLELGAGTRGSCLGPDALWIASLNDPKSKYSSLPYIRINRENSELNDKIDTPYAKRVQCISEVYDEVCNIVAGQIKGMDKFPLIISGDHSTAGGTIAGVKMSCKDKRVGVIWIDAHADIHSPYTTPSGNVHGMPVASALGLDNIEVSTNNISDKTKEMWEKMKNTGGVSPKINAEDIVMISVRDKEEQESFAIKKHGIKQFSVQDVRNIGGKMIAEQAIDYLSECDMVYVSFDADSLDTSVSIGTGTPVPNGIFLEEAKEMLDTLVSNNKIKCLEVVEINPCLDTENKMATAILSLLESMIEKLEKRFDFVTEIKKG